MPWHTWLFTYIYIYIYTVYTQYVKGIYKMYGGNCLFAEMETLKNTEHKQTVIFLNVCNGISQELFLIQNTTKKNSADE